MNIAFDEVGSLVNKDGLVKIGGDIFQFTKEAIKILKGGNAKKVDELKKASVDAGLIIIKPIINNNSSNGRVESYYFQSSPIPVSGFGYCCGFFNSWLEKLSYQIPIYDYSIIVGTQCFLGICAPIYYISGYQDKIRVTADGSTLASFFGSGVPWQQNTFEIASTYTVNGVPQPPYVDYVNNTTFINRIIYDGVATSVNGIATILAARIGEPSVHYYSF